MSETKKKTTGALELILLRNTFYRDNYKRALLALFFLIVTNIILAGTVAYKVFTPPVPQYFATTADGTIINWHPLSDPVVTDDFVLQWTSNAVRQAFSLDFEHWRSQLQRAAGLFTPLGWKYFLHSLKQSNNLKTLTSQEMVSNAVITGAPKLLEQEVVGGVYAWKIQLPIMVTYKNAKQTIPMPMDVTVIVTRASVKEYPDRIAINNFLPVVENTGDQRMMDEI